MRNTGKDLIGKWECRLSNAYVEILNERYALKLLSINGSNNLINPGEELIIFDNTTPAIFGYPNNRIGIVFEKNGNIGIYKFSDLWDFSGAEFLGSFSKSTSI